MKLCLNALEVPCVIGDLASERLQEQTLAVDLELDVADTAAETDRLADTADYAALAASVRETLRAARCRMIERAAFLACNCALALPSVRAAEARVTKRGAVPGLGSATAVFASSASHPIDRSAEI